MHKLIQLIALTGTAAMLVLAMAGCSPGAASAPVDQSNPGGQLVATKCVLCHSIDRVEEATYDKAGWSAVVTRMEANGLVITPDEKTAIVDYLGTR